MKYLVIEKALYNHIRMACFSMMAIFKLVDMQGNQSEKYKVTFNNLIQTF